MTTDPQILVKTLKKDKYPLENKYLFQIELIYYNLLPKKTKTKFKASNIPLFVVTYGYLTSSKDWIESVKVYVDADSYEVLYVYDSKNKQNPESVKADELESFSMTSFSKAADLAISHLKKNKNFFLGDANLLEFKRVYYNHLPDEVKSKFKAPNIPIIVVSAGLFTSKRICGGGFEVYVDASTYKILCAYGTK